MARYKKDRPTSRRTKRYVAYYRVSTKEQGQSGLGLDDQKHKVESTVGKEKIIAEFTEIESGRKKIESSWTMQLHTASKIIAHWQLPSSTG